MVYFFRDDDFPCKVMGQMRGGQFFLEMRRMTRMRKHKTPNFVLRKAVEISPRKKMMPYPGVKLIFASFETVR
jgi:hypothetical protein